MLNGCRVDVRHVELALGAVDVEASKNWFLYISIGNTTIIFSSCAEGASIQHLLNLWCKVK